MDFHHEDTAGVGAVIWPGFSAHPYEWLLGHRTAPLPVFENNFGVRILHVEQESANLEPSKLCLGVLGVWGGGMWEERGGTHPMMVACQWKRSSKDAGPAENRGSLSVEGRRRIRRSMALIMHRNVNGARTTIMCCSCGTSYGVEFGSYLLSSSWEDPSVNL